MLHTVPCVLHCPNSRPSQITPSTPEAIIHYFRTPYSDTGPSLPFRVKRTKRSFLHEIIHGKQLKLLKKITKWRGVETCDYAGLFSANPQFFVGVWYCKSDRRIRGSTRNSPRRNSIFIDSEQHDSRSYPRSCAYSM